MDNSIDIVVFDGRRQFSDRKEKPVNCQNDGGYLKPVILEPFYHIEPPSSGRWPMLTCILELRTWRMNISLSSPMSRLIWFKRNVNNVERRTPMIASSICIKASFDISVHILCNSHLSIFSYIRRRAFFGEVLKRA